MVIWKGDVFIILHEHKLMCAIVLETNVFDNYNNINILKMHTKDNKTIFVSKRDRKKLIMEWINESELEKQYPEYIL